MPQQHNYWDIIWTETEKKREGITLNLNVLKDQLCNKHLTSLLGVIKAQKLSLNETSFELLSLKQKKIPRWTNWERSIMLCF